MIVHFNFYEVKVVAIIMSSENKSDPFPSGISRRYKSVLFKALAEKYNLSVILWYGHIAIIAIRVFRLINNH